MAGKRKVSHDELMKQMAPDVIEVEEETEEEEEEEEEEEDEDEEEEEEEEESSEEEEEEEVADEKESSEEEEKQDDESKKEHIRNLLQPFGKEKLIEILKEAASSNPSIFKQIVDSAEADPVHRKIFVHGLSWDATSEHVSAAFKQFGKIEECTVVTDKVTGKSKGYAFVLFKTRSGAVKALKQPQKMIGGRMTACQLAAAGPPANANSNASGTAANLNANAGVSGFASSDMASRKLHVKNVGPEVSVERLRNFFSLFGEIEQGPVGVDKATGKLRGYAIFVYKTVDGIKKALEEPIKNFEGLKLECSVAREGKFSKGNQNAGITVENVDVGTLLGSSAPGNTVIPSYPYGFNPALLGVGAFYLNQNPGLAVMNPFLGMSGALGQAGFPTNFMGGIAQGVDKGTVTPVGSSAGFGMQQGVSAVSPSVIASYGSQEALQGSGAFQGSRVGQSSSNAKDLMPTSGAGLGNFNFGR